MNSDGLLNSDQWLERIGRDDHVVLSSRARYARNIPKLPFPSRATPEELINVLKTVTHALKSITDFRDGYVFDLTSLPSNHRHFLRENHLISREMGSGGAHRLIFLDKNISLGAMVNEEDHLRLFSLETGFSINNTINKLIALECELEHHVNFAFSDHYGYLTACPSNAGTGLRLSALLHLPAMHALGMLQSVITEFPSLGLTIRGAYGEFSEITGDLFQISNEVTLGRSEEDIAHLLTGKIENIIRAEENARRTMFDKSQITVENEVFRSVGILTHARLISSDEAVRRLSWLRIGLDCELINGITHNDLNQLMIKVQPGHIKLLCPSQNDEHERDESRADFIREKLKFLGK